MKTWLAAMVCVFLTVSGSFAKDKNWQEGRVVRMEGSIPQRGFYWIRGTEHSYLIHNYANGTVVQWWVRLTLGDTVRISSDGKNLRVMDNQSKEQKCQILQEVTNSSYDVFAAKEAAKTPEQLLAEQQHRDAVALQQQAMRQQAIRDLNKQLSDSTKSEPIKPLPTPQTIHCESRTLGDTTTTDCR